MVEPEHVRGDFAPGASPDLARIRMVTMALVVERGWDATTVDDVLGRSGVAPAEFAARFADLRDCGTRIYLANIENFDVVVFAAAESGAAWRDRLRATAYAAASYVRDRPLETRFDMIQMLEAGEMTGAYRDRYVHRIVDLIDAGRQELDDPDSMGRGVAEGVFGSIYEFVIKEIQAGRGTRSAVDFVPELMYIAVRPYLGHEVAREELNIPPPPEAEPMLRNKREPKPDMPVQSDDSPRYRAGVAKRKPSGEKTPPGLSRLPPGRHGLSREFVIQNQRDRLTAGMIATVAARGYHETTISQIAEAAGVSRRTFYGYFSGKEECFFATYELITSHLQESAKAAAEPESEWPRKVRARLLAVLETFAANSDLVRFTMLAPQAAGGEVADRYRVEMDRALSILIDGIPDDARRPSMAAEQGLLGAVAALVVREVRDDNGDDLPRLLPDLLELVLAPYLGRAAAARAARG